MPPLRIAMLSVHSCPLGQLGTRDTGGMSVYVREIAGELGKLGCRVDVFTRSHSPAEEKIVRLGTNARLVHLAAGDDRLDKAAMYPHLPDFTANLEDFRRAAGMEYDLIFSHYWLSGLVGASLRQAWQMPHFVMFHTLGAVKNRVSLGVPEPAQRLKSEAELAGSARIIATTPREKRFLVEHCGAPAGNVAVVPCGVNLELFQPIDRRRARGLLGLDADDRVLLIVGRIEPLKGIEQAIKAMPLLPPAVKMIIVGGDEDSREVARLRTLARACGVDGSLIFTGTVNHEQLPYYYSAADVTIVPSYYESFSLVALESLACGTPLVANDVGGLREIVRQGLNGFIVPGNSPAHLAEKIGRLLASPASSKTQAAARASVIHFGWSNIARWLLDEFGLVADSTGSPAVAGITVPMRTS